MRKWCLTPIIAAALVGAPAAAGDLVVSVEALRSDKGDIRLALFVKDGWLDEKRRVGDAVVKAALPATRVVLPNLAPGTYGIALYHDENGNGRHDTNFFGLPLEGFGFSRDAPLNFGPPSFDDARFQVGADGVEIRLRVRY